MFKVIKPIKKTRGKKPIYPFGNMDVGDAFVAPRNMGLYKGSDKRQKSISSSAADFSNRRGGYMKFSTALVDSDRVLCRRVK